MKVKDLIKKLQECNSEAEVVCEIWTNLDSPDIETLNSLDSCFGYYDTRRTSWVLVDDNLPESYDPVVYLYHDWKFVNES